LMGWLWVTLAMIGMLPLLFIVAVCVMEPNRGGMVHGTGKPPTVPPPKRGG
jgi:hypothetical protein